MTAVYMPVREHLIGTLDDYVFAYTSSDAQFTDREQAIEWGMGHYNSDDFRIATLVDGLLSAIGHGMDDFDPVAEDLPDIARYLGLEVAA